MPVEAISHTLRLNHILVIIENLVNSHRTMTRVVYIANMVHAKPIKNPSSIIAIGHLPSLHRRCGQAQHFGYLAPRPEQTFAMPLYELLHIQGRKVQILP
jgi:hypothetical protein